MFSSPEINFWNFGKNRNITWCPGISKLSNLSPDTCTLTREQRTNTEVFKSILSNTKTKIWHFCKKEKKNKKEKGKTLHCRYEQSGPTAECSFQNWLSVFCRCWVVFTVHLLNRGAGHCRYNWQKYKPINFFYLEGDFCRHWEYTTCMGHHTHIQDEPQKQPNPQKYNHNCHNWNYVQSSKSAKYIT